MDEFLFIKGEEHSKSKKKNQIREIDNFLPDDMRQICYKALSRPNWSFDGGGSHSRFWHMNDLQEDWFFSKSMFKYVKYALGGYSIPGGDQQEPITVQRIYANGQTACQSGVVHRDDDNPNAWTLIYYSTPNWEPEYAGNTQFFSNDKTNIIRTVQYVSNRAVVFPSTLQHMSEAPARQYHGLRTTIAYKLLLPSDNTTTLEESKTI